MIRNIKQLLNKWEPLLFIGIALLNMFPVMQGKFFGNMDGASHLYNANLIKELLFGDNPLISSYFTFNPEPVPNLLTHFLLALFNVFLPSFLAEKLLLVLYLLGLPLAFRALIKHINPDNILASYFIFPFTYSYMFLLGFYNFSFAIIFMLLALRYWLKYREELNSKRILILVVIVALCYFSHLFLFVIFLMATGVILTFNFFTKLIPDLGLYKATSKFFKSIASLILVVLLPLSLAAYYVLSRSGDSHYIFLELRELIDSIKNVRTIIAYNATVEEAYTKKIFLVFGIILIIVLYNWVNRLLDQYKQSKSIQSLGALLVSKNMVWAIIPAFLLILYLIMPDEDGSGAYFSSRIALFLFLFYILWMSAQQLKKWLLLLGVLVVLFLNFKLNKFYYNTIKDLNKTVASCYDVADQIPENSIVLPLSYTDNWLMGHFFYIGLDKPTVVLENYECSWGYFPLLWNYDDMPNAKLGGKIQTNEVACLYWPTNYLNGSSSIDYIFVLGHLENQTDWCRIEARNAIFENYDLHYQNEHCELYKLK